MDTFVWTQLPVYKVPSCQTVKYTSIKVLQIIYLFWIYKSGLKITSPWVLFHCCKLCNIPAGMWAFWKKESTHTQQAPKLPSHTSLCELMKLRAPSVSKQKLLHRAKVHLVNVPSKAKTKTKTISVLCYCIQVRNTFRDGSTSGIEKCFH